MKKKTIAATLGSCLILALSACARNDVPKDMEPIKDISVNIPEEKPENNNEEANPVEKEDFSEIIVGNSDYVNDIEIGEYDPERPYDFSMYNGIVTSNYAVTQDKSEEYGVYSTSCSDANAFLNEDGSPNLRALGKTGEIGNYDYSGRFAYPLVSENEYIKNLILEYKGDIEEEFSFTDGNEYQGVITVWLGTEKYQFNLDSVEADYANSEPVEIYGDLINSANETVTVVTRDRTSNDMGYSVYYYTIGDFTVEIQRNANDTLFTTEELTEIMKGITLI